MHVAYSAMYFSKYDVYVNKYITQQNTVVQTLNQHFNSIQLNLSIWGNK
jgi:hypothetical protein